MNTAVEKNLVSIDESTPTYASVSWGKKTVAGEKTETQCIIFGVPEKRSIDDIPEEERLPSTVTIEGVEYETDVIEEDTMEFLACSAETLQTCYTWTSSIDGTVIEGYTSPPTHQTKIRPIKGGLQIGYANGNNYVNTTGVGTLGLIAVDSITDSLVGITNAHVAALDWSEPTLTWSKINEGAFGVTNDHYTKANRIFGNPYYRVSTGVANKPTAQENPYELVNIVRDAGGTVNFTTSFEIGKLIRFFPIITTEAVYKPPAWTTGSNAYNDIDAAVIGLKSSVISLTESWKQHELTSGSQTPAPWASKSEIDNLISTDPYLFSSGRTTGAKGEGACKLKIAAVGWTGTVSRGGFFGNYARFRNVLRFTREDSTCPWPIAGGDSGSALLADIGGTIKVIGLVFAGSKTDGLAIRIDKIAHYLQVEAWDGTAKNYIDLDNPQIVTYSGLQTGSVFYKYSDYWYAGFYTSSAASPIT